VVAGSADNGRYHAVSSMPTAERFGGCFETYGTQLSAHRHRRNRPCTYPSYHRCQHIVHLQPVIHLLLESAG